VTKESELFKSLGEGQREGIALWQEEAREVQETILLPVEGNRLEGAPFTATKQ
jgi:hypothetical protein